MLCRNAPAFLEESLLSACFRGNLCSGVTPVQSYRILIVDACNTAKSLSRFFFFVPKIVSVFSSGMFRKLVIHYIGKLTQELLIRGLIVCVFSLRETRRGPIVFCCNSTTVQKNWNLPLSIMRIERDVISATGGIVITTLKGWVHPKFHPFAIPHFLDGDLAGVTRHSSGVSRMERWKQTSPCCSFSDSSVWKTKEIRLTWHEDVDQSIHFIYLLGQLMAGIRIRITILIGMGKLLSVDRFCVVNQLHMSSVMCSVGG